MNALARLWGNGVGRFRTMVVLTGGAFLFGLALADMIGLVPAGGSSAGRPEGTIASFFLPVPPAMPVAPIASAQALYGHFTEQGYTLDAVRRDGVVPRLFLARLPNDLPALNSVETRKEIFLKMLLPLVLAENERILTDRIGLAALREAQANDHEFSASDRAWLEALAGRYGLESRRPRDLLNALILRVDVVPPSLALGQAALESGWGTSRSAQGGAAMFGQMVFTDDSGPGEVRRFERLAHAVEAYALNLNTHRAYARFRAKRAELRARGAAVDGYNLAQTLASYSERKADYVRDVRSIIRGNKLGSLDSARLD